MVNKLLITILLVLLAAPAGAVQILRGSTSGTCADTSCTGFLVCQNYEGTGTDNSEPWLTSWGDGSNTPSTGVLTYDYTTSPGRGSQSLRHKDDATYGGASVWKFSNDTGVSGIYGHIMLKITDLPNANDDSTAGTEIITIYNVQGTFPSGITAIDTHQTIRIRTDGKLGVQFDGQSSAASIAGTYTLSTNTWYHLWFYITRTTTSNGAGWVKIGTTETIPGTDDISWSGKTIAASYVGMNAIGFTSQHAASYEYHVDQALVKTSAIGDVCE